MFFPDETDFRAEIRRAREGIAARFLRGGGEIFREILPRKSAARCLAKKFSGRVCRWHGAVWKKYTVFFPDETNSSIIDVARFPGRSE